MRTRELRELFEAHEDEFVEFENVTNPRSKRPDLNAFLLLEELIPGEGDMISGAWDGKIRLDIDLLDLVEVITEEQVIELIRCGVWIDEENRLVMFA